MSPALVFYSLPNGPCHRRSNGIQPTTLFDTSEAQDGGGCKLESLVVYDNIRQ